MDKIIELSTDNINLLTKFLENTIPQSFRYFNKRDITVIKNHIVTLLLLNNNNPIGYAHIDYDDNKYWFGICILDEYQGKGYGNLLINYILNHNKIKKINKIYLTVDKINIHAINLYFKYKFKILSNYDTYYLMIKNIS